MRRGIETFEVAGSWKTAELNGMSSNNAQGKRTVTELMYAKVLIDHVMKSTESS